MSTIDMTNQIRQLKELESLIKEAQAEAEAIKRPAKGRDAAAERRGNDRGCLHRPV